MILRNGLKDYSRYPKRMYSLYPESFQSRRKKLRKSIGVMMSPFFQNSYSHFAVTLLLYDFLVK